MVEEHAHRHHHQQQQQQPLPPHHHPPPVQATPSTNEYAISENMVFNNTSDDTPTVFARWIDGPITTIAAMVALLGAFFACRFLLKAGLNKHLTAALFALCVIDSLLMCTVIMAYSIEAIGMALAGTNIMYNSQSFTTSLHGVASSMTTSSTLLVIYITFIRCMVVVQPLRFANIAERSTRSTQRRKGRKEYSASDSATLLSTQTPMDYVRDLELRKMMKPYLLPGSLIFVSFLINIPVYFEFRVERCFDIEHHRNASAPYSTVFRDNFAQYKAVLNTLTQTIGPVISIAILTVITEIKVHRSLRERRRLFESQKRDRAVVLTEELKEKVSRTVSIFIAVKFLILRSLPLLFDVYENLYGIQSFGPVLSILVRVSDFMIVLNSATNSLAYFGRKRWLENRLRLRLQKKEEKRQRNLSVSADSRRQSTQNLAVGRQTVSCTTSVCPPALQRGKTSQSCRVPGERQRPYMKYPLSGSSAPLQPDRCSPLASDCSNRTSISSRSVGGVAIRSACESPRDAQSVPCDPRRLSALSTTSEHSTSS